MSAKAKARQAVVKAEESARDAAEYVPTHLHGNEATCPCGAEGGGLVTIALTDDYELPDRCSVCGKPTSEWGDLRAARHVERHRSGCPAGPEPDLCAVCKYPIGSGVLVLGDGGFMHFRCDPDTEDWTP